MIRLGAYLKKFLMISVVVPVRDARALLERCLESLDRQTVDRSDYEVIVVDDGSSDGSAEVARKWGARVFRQEKKGAGAARNRGIQEAKGEVILFLDADCEAAREWMAKLSEPIGKDATRGTVGRFTSDQENWVARLIQIEIEGRYHRMRHYDRIDFVNSATFGLTRELLLNNLFDESFQKLEDVELSFRLAQKGSRLVYVPGATVRHSHPESLYAYLRRKFRYARALPALYRRFPEKMLADSSTPQYRRWQLLLLGLAVPGLLMSPFVSLILLLGSIGFSMPTIVRAFQKSTKLGVLSPFFVLTGNMVFLLGLSSGMVPAKARNSATPDRAR